MRRIIVTKIRAATTAALLLLLLLLSGSYHCFCYRKCLLLCSCLVFDFTCRHWVVRCCPELQIMNND